MAINGMEREVWEAPPLYTMRSVEINVNKPIRECGWSSVVCSDVRGMRLRGRPWTGWMDGVERVLNGRGMSVEQGRIFVGDGSECMSNNTTLATVKGGSWASGVTLGLYKVWGGEDRSWIWSGKHKTWDPHPHLHDWPNALCLVVAAKILPLYCLLVIRGDQKETFENTNLSSSFENCHQIIQTNTLLIRRGAPKPMTAWQWSRTQWRRLSTSVFRLPSTNTSHRHRRCFLE